MTYRTDSNAHQQLADALKALAHPARLRLLEILARRGGCVCGELVDAMPLSQATVSQHLKVLKEAGLIQGEADGPRICYCIAPENMARLRAHIVSLFGSIENCCKTQEGPET